MDDQRRTNHEHHVGLTRQIESLVDGIGGHRLADKDPGWSKERPSAVRATRRHLHLETRLHLRPWFELAAFKALHCSARTVQPHDTPPARGLMQPLHVL